MMSNTYLFRKFVYKLATDILNTKAIGNATYVLPKSECEMYEITTSDAIELLVEAGYTVDETETELIADLTIRNNY